MKDNEKIVTEYYEQWEENERVSRDAAHMVEYNVTMSYIEKHLFPGCKILELGCGNGSHWDDKIETLLTSLEKMQQMIDNNNQEIAQFKKEFEKRNPTQTEKLNLRSLDSYPFNVNPKDYWDEKGIDPNSNYSGYADNDEPTDKEYIITNSDVDDFDERAISQSFNIDDELNQDIKKIFGL